jgi:hypothetical protein
MSLSESQHSIHPNFLGARLYIGPGSKKASSLLDVYLYPFGLLSLNIRRKLDGGGGPIYCIYGYNFLDFCLLYISFLVPYNTLILCHITLLLIAHFSKTLHNNSVQNHLNHEPSDIIIVTTFGTNSKTFSRTSASYNHVCSQNQRVP